MVRFLLIFLFSFTALASDLTVLKKGETAPYDGVLASPKQMRVFREKNEELKLTKSKVLVLEDLKMSLEKSSKYYKSEADDYRTKLRKTEFTGFFKSVGMFVLGAFTVGLAAKVMEKR